MSKWTEERKEAARAAYQRRHKINKTEDFNGEEDTDINGYDRMKMGYNDKLQSMRNAIMILPPNMIVDGRHLKENIQAICGFPVNDHMMDTIYENFSHED